MGIGSSFTTYRHRAANKTVGNIQQPRIHAGEMFKGKNNLDIILEVLFFSQYNLHRRHNVHLRDIFCHRN